MEHTLAAIRKSGIRFEFAVDGGKRIKRIMDILIVILILPIALPLLFVVAIIVKLTSRGPVFFLQERVGLDNRRFNIIKFRSMLPDAESQLSDVLHLNEADGPIFKIRQDPRVTFVGRYLRRYSIDELPQLINVLRGEMSLVGPRPHPTDEVAQYSSSHARRLSVQPGMTGLAQVSGRSSLAWNDAVALDLHYIDNWNNFADVRILARTFRAVVSTQGSL